MAYRAIEKLGANSITVVAADTNNINHNRGFMVDADGVASIRLSSDTALVALPVLKGLVYPFDVVQFDKTGSTTVTTLYLLKNLSDGA